MVLGRIHPTLYHMLDFIAGIDSEDPACALME